MKIRWIGPVMALMIALGIAMAEMPMTTTAAADKAPAKGVSITIEWGQAAGSTRLTASANPAETVNLSTYTRWGFGGTIPLNLTPSPDVRIYAGPPYMFELTAVMFSRPGESQAFFMSNWFSGQCPVGPTVVYTDKKAEVMNTTGAVQYASSDDGASWRTLQPGQSVKVKDGQTLILSPNRNQFNTCLRTTVF